MTDKHKQALEALKELQGIHNVYCDVDHEFYDKLFDVVREALDKRAENHIVDTNKMVEPVDERMPGHEQNNPAQECPHCGGTGCEVEVHAACCGNLYDHGECRGDCAVPEQVQVACSACGGVGKHEPQPIDGGHDMPGDLKPCPFCGVELVSAGDPDFRQIMEHPENDCYLSAMVDEVYECDFPIWNRRADLKPLSIEPNINSGKIDVSELQKDIDLNKKLVAEIVAKTVPCVVCGTSTEENTCLCDGCGHEADLALQMKGE